MITNIEVFSKLILLYVIFAMVVISHAYYNYYRISILKRNIKHGLESILYGGICVLLTLIFAISIWFDCIILCVSVRYSYFDPFLNKFRGLSFLYESKTTTSIIDKIEKKIIEFIFKISKGKIKISIKFIRIVAFLMPIVYIFIRSKF